MRILQLGKYYAPHKGGMETALRHMVEGLLACGHEVRVLVAGESRRTVRHDLPGVQGGLVRAGVLGTLNSQPLALEMPGLLRDEIRRFRPDIVHIHLPNPLACWAWLTVQGMAAEVGSVLAVWHHADIVRQRFAGRIAAPLVARCLASAAGICVSSSHLRDHSPQLTRWRQGVRVIPFGINAWPYENAPSPLPTQERPFVFVGRLVRYKGLDVLLDAVSELPGAQLDIIGTGPLREALAARASAPLLTGRVRLRGEIGDEELPALLAASRALVLPSRDRSETFGLVLLEAMAAGLPLVVSDLPTGVRDLARPGETAWTVPPGDATALRGAMASILADPEEARRRGMAGRELVRRQYTRERMASALADWYRELRAGDA